MNITLVGATGYVGGALLQELLARGHHVTALARNVSAISPQAHLRAVQADVADTATLVPLLRGQDAVISAFSPGLADADLQRNHLAGARSILQAVQAAGVPRYLVVGGAGTLEAAPGVQLVDTPEFPAEWKGTALSTRAVLAELAQAPESLAWTALCPPPMLVPGERTGRYRSGGRQVLSDEAGHSQISVQDYAVAMVDELERPQHARQLFTVAY